MTNGRTPSALLLGTAGATALAVGGWYAWQTQDHTLRVATVAIALLLVGAIGAARELRLSGRKSAAGATFLLWLLATAWLAALPLSVWLMPLAALGGAAALATATLARRLLRRGRPLGAVIDSLLLTGVAWAAFAAPTADPWWPVLGGLATASAALFAVTAATVHRKRKTAPPR